VLRVLAGLERPQRGYVRHGRQTWFDAEERIFLPPERRDIGFLFQEYALFPHLTVEGNIAYGAHGMTSAAAAARLRELVSAFGLSGLEQRRPQQLSGGQQQRVALARTVFRRPSILLLDEPLSALDTASREQIRSELGQLIHALAIPTYVVTHDRADALTLGQRTVLFDEGRIVQSGATRDVFNRPLTPAAARLVGVDSVLMGTVSHVQQGLATVRVGDVDVCAEAPGRGGGDVALCISAEDVVLARHPHTDMSARNQWPAKVLFEVAEGPFVRVTVDCGFPLTALVTRDGWERLALRRGDRALAIVKATSIRVLQR
jgi:molybdate transport system ATP-binding protein